MSKEEDRQALLEKIRADMAASRQKIAEMKEKKARGTVNLDKQGEEEKVSDAKKFEETTSLVERLRAERAAKKSGAPVLTEKAIDISSTTAATKKTTEQSKDRFRPNPGRMRGPSIDQGRTRQPSMDQGRFRTPSMDQGRSRQPSIDQGRRMMGNRGPPVVSTQNPPAKKTTPPQSATSDAKTEKVRSLADMQRLIEKAGEVKKNAEKQCDEEQQKREVRDARKKEMTREERRAYRQSKRMTVEMQQNESRVKIDQQIGGFMMMMQKLESDWQRGEEARIKSLEDMAEQRKLMEKVGNQMEFLTGSLSDLSARMDHMKLMLDRLVDGAPKSAKKEEKWFADLTAFQGKFWKMRHDAYISTAKYKKMMEEQMNEEREKAAAAGQNPPPAPALKPGAAGAGMVNPISNLLGQIRQGTSLKKLDPKQVEEEKKNRKQNWRQSVALLEGLQDTLRDALDQRHLSLFSDEESDEDWDEDSDE